MGRPKALVRDAKYDFGELAVVTFLQAKTYGKPYVLLPATIVGRNQHHTIFYNADKGPLRPQDLNGKRVALDTLQNSAGLWMRGILQDHYGVDLKTIEWWCQEEEDVPFEPAKWMKLKRVPQGKNVDQMLLDSELEGALYPEVLPSIRKGSPKVALLFPDPKAAEIDYYKKSGIFPIMHTVVIKNHILDNNPWAAVSLMRAFQRAKEVCYERMRDPRSFALVWVQDLMREQQQVFGGDPWPYNLDDNRKTLEAAVRYEYEQGMIRKKPEIEDLFFPPSLQRIQHYV